MLKHADKLLVVDASSSVRDFFARLGRRLGYQVERAVDWKEMNRRLAGSSVAVVVVGFHGTSSECVKIFESLCEQTTKPCVILVSTASERRLLNILQLASLMGIDVRDALTIPASIDAVRTVLVRSMSRIRRLEKGAVSRLGTNFQAKATPGRGGWIVTDVVASPRLGSAEDPAMFGDFLALGRQIPSVAQLGKSMIRRLLEEVRRRDRLHQQVNGCVAYSPSLLTDPALADRIPELVKQSGLQLERLTLEFSQDAVSFCTGRAMDVLNRLHGKGIRLALGDFGTGYSSLDCLRRQPFAEIAIDRTLTDNAMAGDDQARRLVDSIIYLGHRMGRVVTAKGADSQTSMPVLAAMGFDKVQGSALDGDRMATPAFPKRA